MIDVVAFLDVALALAASAGAFLLYPPAAAAFVTLVAATCLGGLGRWVHLRSTTGYAFQFVLFFGLTFPLARTGWPFGVAPMVMVLVTWLLPSVRREFDLCSTAPAGQVPAANEAAFVWAQGMAALGLALGGWMVRHGAPLFGGPSTGHLAVFCGPEAILGLGALCWVCALGLSLGRSWAYWATPTILAVPLLAVFPLGRAVLPLLALWPSRLVAAHFSPLPRPGAARLLALVIPAIALAAAFRLVPVGSCPRHGDPLLLYGWHETFFIAGGSPRIDGPAPPWEGVKVVCPATDLAFHHRDLVVQCMTARWSKDPRLGLAFECPLDRALREELGPNALPPNRFDLIASGGHKTLRCRTCSAYALAPVDRSAPDVDRSP